MRCRRERPRVNTESPRSPRDTARVVRFPEIAMSYFRPILSAALVAALAPASVLAQASTSAPKAVERIEIIAPEQPVFVGTALKLEARVWTKGSTVPDSGARVFWDASNLTGAWVTDNGTVLLFEPGELTISARSGSASASRRIFVRPNQVERVEITGEPTGPVRVGETVTFAATLTGKWREAVKGAQPNWAVAVGSDATYGTAARITPDGRFTATAPGAYTVLAEMNGRADIAQVIVRDPSAQAPARSTDVDPARRVEIPEPATRPYAGTTIPMRAVVRSLVTRDASSGARIRWTSSDPSVASIAPNGALALHRPGRTTITADHEGEIATRDIRVLPNPAGRIVLRSNTRDAAPGATVLLHADIWAPGAQLIRDARPNIAVIAHDATEADVIPAVDGEGRFVPAKAGVYTVIAEIGGLASQTTITVRDPAFGRR